jgi:hypothetical protein
MPVLARPHFNFTVVVAPIDEVIESFTSLNAPQLAPVQTNFSLPRQPYSAVEATEPMIFWAPAANPQLTAFMSNVMSGNYFFAQYLGTRFNVELIEVRSTQDGAEEPINELVLYKQGKRARVVRTMRDANRWNFYTEGSPMAWEDTTQYIARKIQDRFSRTQLLNCVESWGAAVRDDAFWQPKDVTYTFQRNDG